MAGVTITIKETGISRLADPALMRDIEARIIDSVVDALVPVARNEAPSRTGRSKTFIFGQVRQQGGHPTGRIYAGGKGYALRILGAGTTAHKVVPKSRNRRVLTYRRVRSGKDRPPALMIPVGGGIFRRWAMIPAIAADPWHKRTAEHYGVINSAADAATSAILETVR